MAARKRNGVWGLFLLLLLAAAGGGLYFFNPFKKKPPLSHMHATGKQLELLQSTEPRPEGELYYGDRLITRDFGADLMCTDGTKMHMGPLSDLLIEQDPNGDRRFALTMGAMRLETSAGVIIGTPFGIIHTSPAQVSVLDISVSQGAFVRVGGVAIEHNRVVSQVPQGYQFTIDGLVLPIHANDGITLQEIVLDLVKRPDSQNKGVSLSPLNLLLYPKKDTRYAPQTRAPGVPRNPQALAQNDRVQTSGPGASILAEAWGRYLLDEGTDIAIGRTGQLKRKREARVGFWLHNGGLTFLGPAHDNTTFTTTVQIHGRELEVSPGLMLAQAHIKMLDDGARVKLRFGKLVLGERHVEAGHIATLSGDDVLVEPLSAAHVNVTGDMATIVHYPTRQVPVVNFIWSPASTPAPMTIEIAAEPAFVEVPFAESVRAGSFMVDQLVNNATYYWRAGGADATPHQLQLQSEVPECPSCVPPDVISDAVPHTVIEFDESVTQIAFQWRVFAGAKYYLFRMYNDGQFDKPVVVQHANSPNYLLPPTHLNPGVYFWNVIAYDDQGRLLHKGNMSDFEIQEPDELPPLTVEWPKEGQTLRGAQLVTMGQARRRAKLTCNGVAIPTDGDGRFKHPIPLRSGSNFLVYKIEVNKRMRHLYTRTVLRQ